tara:strand:- start:552 stop:1220 length:669 start_codon:yes stop_codon:yes gene_type:complete
MKELQEIQQKLKVKIPFKWRVQSFSKYKAQATCVSYIDSRDVQDILDSSCVWSDRYYSEGGLLFCEITIYADGREYKRTDTGSESNVDKQKGHSSDAFKRAAVKFGVGRFLYSQPMQYVTSDAIKTNGNYPNVIDNNGNKVWDLTKHINLKLKTPVKTTVKSPIKKPSEKLKECKNLKELAAVYTALTRTEQTAMTALKNELKDMFGKEKNPECDASIIDTY